MPERAIAPKQRTNERARAHLSSLAVVLALGAAGGALWLATDEPPFPSSTAGAAARGEIGAAPAPAPMAPPRRAGGSNDAIRSAIDRHLATAGLDGALSAEDRDHALAAVAEIRNALGRGKQRPSDVARGGARPSLTAGSAERDGAGAEPRDPIAPHRAPAGIEPVASSATEPPPSAARP